MNDTTSRERVLRWTLIAGVAFFLCATVAVIGFAWWMRSRSSTDEGEATVRRPGTEANWSRATFSTGAQEGVRQTSDKSWSVKGGRAFMNVRRKDDDTLEFRFVYPFDSLSRETVKLVRIRWNLRELEKKAEDLNITPEQMASLKAISPATDMPVSNPDKEHLRSLFENYLATRESAIEKGLVEAVADLDGRYYERTMERIEGIAEKMKSILNADQVAVLFEGNPNRENHPTGQPPANP